MGAQIVLITGIMASGKSTVAQAVAERLPMSVHLRGDSFRKMIVNGRIEVDPEAGEAALDQLRLRYRLSAAVADLYCQAGFTVVYQDVIVGPMLTEVVELNRQWPLALIVLCPSPEVVARREAGRGKVGYREWTPELLDHELRANTPHIGLWLDTSEHSVEQTVNTILARLDEALITT
ncbi:MAG TPA: AAA family ATPase [Phototrophicaceae bacterium]|nr:AAA family ATPase [Phototrophicaceae bacterium]